MGESRDAKPAGGALPKTEGDTPGTRDKEATSSETLSDVEGSEKVSGGSAGGSGSSPLEGSSPRPSTEGGGGGAPTAATRRPD